MPEHVSHKHSGTIVKLLVIYFILIYKVESNEAMCINYMRQNASALKLVVLNQDITQHLGIRYTWSKVGRFSRKW